MRKIMVLAALAACGAEPAARVPQPSHGASDAIAALRAGDFERAAAEAGAVLARDPRSSQAAAVRAFARYDRAVGVLSADLREAIQHAVTGNNVRGLDHVRGRASWQTFLDELAAIDRDLAVAAADPAFALELCPACWRRDWTRDGTIDEGDERLLEVEYDRDGRELPAGDPRRRPEFRFDRGDALWARALLQFQRAGVELVLAYRWSQLDRLILPGDDGAHLVIELADAARVRRAHELVIAGLGFADQTRRAYLAETDDDREWVPSPRQRSYAVPLAVDARLYETWEHVIGDVHRLLDSREGLALRELAELIDGPDAAALVPDAYVDLGRMLREPASIAIDLREFRDTRDDVERLLRGALGRGYTKAMRASPLVGRLRHMKRELERGDDTLERKLRYLIWLN